MIQKASINWLADELGCKGLMPEDIAVTVQKFLDDHPEVSFYCYVDNATAVPARSAKTHEELGYNVTDGEHWVRTSIDTSSMTVSISGDATVVEPVILFDRQLNAQIKCQQFKIQTVNYLSCDEQGESVKTLTFSDDEVWVDKNLVQSISTKRASEARATAADKALILLAFYYAKHDPDFRTANKLNSSKFADHVMELQKIFGEELDLNDTGLKQLHQYINKLLKTFDLKSFNIDDLDLLHPTRTPFKK